MKCFRVRTWVCECLRVRNSFFCLCVSAIKVSKLLYKNKDVYVWLYVNVRMFEWMNFTYHNCKFCTSMECVSTYDCYTIPLFYIYIFCLCICDNTWQLEKDICEYVALKKKVRHKNAIEISKTFFRSFVGFSFSFFFFVLFLFFITPS